MFYQLIVCLFYCALMFLVIVPGNKKLFWCLCATLQRRPSGPIAPTHATFIYKFRFLLFKLKIHCSITEIPETLLKNSMRATCEQNPDAFDDDLPPIIVVMVSTF